MTVEEVQEEVEGDFREHDEPGDKERVAGEQSYFGRG